KRRSDWGISRHTDVRKSVTVHRQAAGQRRLAYEEHRAGIIVVGGKLTESEQRRYVAARFTKIGHEREGEVPLTHLIKEFGGPNEFLPAACQRPHRCGPQPDIAQAN